MSLPIVPTTDGTGAEMSILLISGGIVCSRTSHLKTPLTTFMSIKKTNKFIILLHEARWAVGQECALRSWMKAPLSCPVWLHPTYIAREDTHREDCRREVRCLGEMTVVTIGNSLSWTSLCVHRQRAQYEERGDKVQYREYFVYTVTQCCLLHGCTVQLPPGTSQGTMRYG